MLSESASACVCPIFHQAEPLSNGEAEGPTKAKPSVSVRLSTQRCRNLTSRQLFEDDIIQRVIKEVTLLFHNLKLIF